MRCYFEDLKVGDAFLSGPIGVSAGEMVAFAREFDPQPFHCDAEAAQASDFGALAASGWHTAALAMRLFVTGSLQFEGGAIGLGVDELRWPAAVWPDDELTLTTEVVELRASRSKPGRGIIRIRNVLRNQRQEIVLSYLATAMVQRRPAR